MANGSVKNPSFIANFSRARTRFCIALNYEEPSDKRWNIYILFWILNKTGDTPRARAHSRPHMSFSSGRVSRCAVIRDDHLRCYYLDNARCIASRGNTYGSQPGQWITLEESAPSSPFVPLPLLRRCSCRCFCCSCCSRYVDEKTIFDSFLYSETGQAEYLDRNSQIADVYPCLCGLTRQLKPPRITRLGCFTK